MNPLPQSWCTTEVDFVYTHLCFCHFCLHIYFIGPHLLLGLWVSYFLQKAHNVCSSALHFCVDYMATLTGSKLCCSLHGCFLLSHHSPGRLKYYHLYPFCPSVWLVGLKGKTLFKHSTWKCQKPSYASGFHHAMITGIDARCSTILTRSYVCN